MTVEEAVAAEHDQADLESPLGALALALARLIDDPRNSATSKSMCSKSLIDTLEALAKMKADRSVSATPLDEIRARRDKKLGVAGRAKAKD